MATDRIRAAFENAKSEGRIALVPYVTVGFPELGLTTDIVRSLVDNGADVIELGVPFSDPLGDGPTIQASGHRALQNGVTPETCIETVKDIRAAGIDVPLIFMGYYNTILNMGIDEFCNAVADAGLDGIIAADLPAAEAGPLQDACDRTGLALVPLIAITSTDDAIEYACKRAKGFVYCISVLGVTGARTTMSTRVEGLATNVRKFTDLPIAIGFGISTPEHVAEVAKFSDGAVVGSQVINTLADGDPEEAAERVGAYIKSLTPGTPRKVVAN
ncbi:MAG: tryptophan synthase subunit alpha [Chloroflexi bacterium]|jgi:tryptophan synthase alpha chain|nr:tryptophan synthase subunit alpha [Chloroflexota bacterium]MBT5627107.1 tryptophan synthase subunit alpha [Chloroflexota bacterium]